LSPVGTSLLAFISGIGPSEMVILGIVAVLLFGKRLPEVGRTVGKGLSELRKGMRGIEQEIYGAVNDNTKPTARRTPPPQRYNDIDDRDEATAPKFEPPPAEPREESP
jgi:sec-independent protein translocase protein TatA